MSQLKIELRQVSASTSEVAIRHHRLLVDRPVEKDGGDSGPMGGELFLVSVGGCFMSNLLAAIKARNAEIFNVRTEVIGILTDTPTRFSALELNVNAESADREMLERLLEVADRGCIMMNTLRGKIDVSIRIGVTV
ncbi:MAG: OsmC family protein [Terriglobia bacterium]